MKHLMNSIMNKIKTLLRTTLNNNHRHNWMEEELYTSIVNGHKHIVENGVALQGKLNHSHKILK